MNDEKDMTVNRKPNSPIPRSLLIRYALTLNAYARDNTNPF